MLVVCLTLNTEEGLASALLLPCILWWCSIESVFSLLFIKYLCDCKGPPFSRPLPNVSSGHSKSYLKFFTLPVSDHKHALKTILKRSGVLIVPCPKWVLVKLYGNGISAKTHKSDVIQLRLYHFCPNWMGPVHWSSWRRRRTTCRWSSRIKPQFTPRPVTLPQFKNDTMCR